MIPGTFLLVTTSKFQKMEGEESECVNEGMFGKAICLYLQEHLTKRGFDIPFFCNEDWGWWVEIKGHPFSFGLLVYCQVDDADRIDEYVIVSSVSHERIWSWRKFRKVPTRDAVNYLMEQLALIFGSDPDVSQIQRLDNFPY